MIQINDIPALLDQLEDHIADDLEGQELDFKQWEAPDGSFLSESQDMSHNPSNPSPAALLLVVALLLVSVLPLESGSHCLSDFQAFSFS